MLDIERRTRLSKYFLKEQNKGERKINMLIPDRVVLHTTFQNQDNFVQINLKYIFVFCFLLESKLQNDRNPRTEGNVLTST